MLPIMPQKSEAFQAPRSRRAARSTDRLMLRRLRNGAAGVKPITDLADKP